jgi:hypothetical protein
VIMNRVHTKSVFRLLQKPGGGFCASLLLTAAIFVGSGFTRPENPGASEEHPELYEPNCVTLVVALHPNCNCAKATIGELVKMYNRVPDELKITVLAFTSEGDTNAWKHTALLSPFTRIPARIIADLNGRTARRLGITTSGQAQLLSPNGKVLYNGGITGACGLNGKNPGEDMVMQIVYGSGFHTENFPAYGCALSKPQLSGAELQIAQRF